MGAFTPESWSKHGSEWLAAVNAVRGDIPVLVFNTQGGEPYDGTRAGLLAELGKRDGVFMFVAPQVRLQKSVAEIMAKAEDRVVAFGRNNSCVQRPFAGIHRVHEELWAGPADLLDMLGRAIGLSNGVGSCPLQFDANYIGYFVEFFQWFAEVIPEGFAHEFDSQLSDGYYSSLDGERLVAVLLDDQTVASN